MRLFRYILYCLFYPIELVLRFWFPYAFRDDPLNPEPQNKEERKNKREKKRQERLENKKEEKPVSLRRKNFKERKIAKLDPNYKSESLKGVYKPPEKTKNYDNEIKEESLLKINNLKQNPKDKKPKQLGLHMVDIESPLTNESAYNLLKEAEGNLTFYWHDEQYHQVAVKFEKDSLKNEYKIRDDVERKKLEPLIRPYQKEYVDRTHVIPIGYHGSESDKRLLIGFSSKINQKDLKNFEEKVANMNTKQSVLWFVDIQRQKNDSVKWHANVWNNDGKVLLQDVFHDKRKFHWKNKRF